MRDFDGCCVCKSLDKTLVRLDVTHCQLCSALVIFVEGEILVFGKLEVSGSICLLRTGLVAFKTRLFPASMFVGYFELDIRLRIEFSLQSFILRHSGVHLVR